MHIKAVRGLFQASSKIVKLTFEQLSGAFSIKVYLQEEHTYTTFNVRAQYGASTSSLPFPPPLGPGFILCKKPKGEASPGPSCTYYINFLSRGNKWTWHIATEEECTAALNHHILSIADLIPDLDIMKRDAYPFKHLIPKKIPHCDPVKESTPKWDEKENLFTRGPPQD